MYVVFWKQGYLWENCWWCLIAPILYSTFHPYEWLARVACAWFLLLYGSSHAPYLQNFYDDVTAGFNPDENFSKSSWPTTTTSSFMLELFLARHIKTIGIPVRCRFRSVLNFCSRFVQVLSVFVQFFFHFLLSVFKEEGMVFSSRTPRQERINEFHQ